MFPWEGRGQSLYYLLYCSGSHHRALPGFGPDLRRPSLALPLVGKSQLELREVMRVSEVRINHKIQETNQSYAEQPGLPDPPPPIDLKYSKEPPSRDESSWLDGG